MYAAVAVLSFSASLYPMAAVSVALLELIATLRLFLAFAMK
jgi:hypothetical protein